MFKIVSKRKYTKKKEDSHISKPDISQKLVALKRNNKTGADRVGRSLEV